jgi:hypothetical protein
MRPRLQRGSKAMSGHGMAADSGTSSRSFPDVTTSFSVNICK